VEISVSEKHHYRTTITVIMNYLQNDAYPMKYNGMKTNYATVW